MYRIFLKTILFFLLSFVFLIIYLSVFGIQTTKFNTQIKKYINSFDERLNLKLEKVYLKLNLSNLSIKINTLNAIIYIEDSSVDIREINTNIDIKNLFNNQEAINNIEIKSKENSIKKVGKFINTYKFNLANFFLFNQVKKGKIIINLSLKKDENFKNTLEIYADGKIIDSQIEITKNYNIKNINFDFKYKDNELNLNNGNFLFNKINFQSKNINIKNENKTYKIIGNLLNEPENINAKFINDIFLPKGKFYFTENNSIFDSKSSFSFEVNSKYKINKLKIDSLINIKQLNFNYKIKDIDKYLPQLNEVIYLEKNKFIISHDDNETNINIFSQYGLKEKKDKFKLNLNYKNNKFLFDTTVNTNNIEILIPEIKFRKDKYKPLEILLQGSYSNGKNLEINKLSLKNTKNLIDIQNLVLNKNFKIDNFKKITLKYINEDNNQNKINFLNKKNEIVIRGESFDGEDLVNKLFENKSKKNFFDIFEKFDKKIMKKIDKFYIDKSSVLNNLNGYLKYKTKKIRSGSILAKLNNKNDFSLDINTSSNNNKITKVLIDNPKPFIKRYKFIKGFREGNLYYESIKSDGTSKSNLRIYNFKIQEVPILAKLLTLASLQGIADVLTGEGIRFNELDMKFTNKSNLMTIEEMYGIGPAISILMEGYIEKDKLVSLRGTLVPATTLNKVISNIPLIGNLLVGKKVGEGVFGVSFKIKGPPKDLKTSVNPIKTLTPRFITRTLEKVKKNK